MSTELISFLRIFLILLLLAAPQALAIYTEVEYSVEWEQKNTPLILKTFQVPLAMRRKVGKTGEFKKYEEFPEKIELKKGKITLKADGRAVLLLTAENPTAEPVEFAVAPHETTPPETAINFNFTCLCNGHVYRVPPRGKWYRYLLLKNDDSSPSPRVTVKHVLFRKKKRAGPAMDH